MIDSGVVSREEKMALRGTDPESYITEYTLVYEDKTYKQTTLALRRKGAYQRPRIASAFG